MTFFGHFVEIEDINGQPLQVGENISQNHYNMDLSSSEVKHIKTTLSNSREKEKYKKT